MSILKMFLAPAFKELETNPKILAIIANLEAAEARLAPILAKLDESSVAQAIASLTGGKITAEEVQTVEEEAATILTSLPALLTELKAMAK